MLLPACAAVRHRWVVECVTKTPLTRLQRRSAGRGGLAAVLASLSPSQLQSVQSMMAQRADGHPLQYVLGDTTFCSLHLLCRPPTLIPRPETEQMTDFIIHTLRHSLSTDTPYPSSAQWPTSVPFAESGAVHRPSPPASPALASFRVLDACTGSGCIALALAAHLGCTTVGVDVADDAIQLARDNLSHIRSQGVSVPLDRATFVLHDLLSPTTPPPWLSSAPFDLLVSNPPYIPSAELSSLQPEVADHEDPRALIAGSDGLLFYFPLIALGYRLTRPSERGWPELVMEIGTGSQVGQVTEACRRTGFGDVRVYDDHAGKKRWVAARRDRRRKPE